jgi:uncharacterized SAM-binding protein YcdF (DUF218 family)
MSRNPILVVLGAPNDPTGKLSPTALSRVEMAARLYKEYGCPTILLTGGFGSHFNISDAPHWSHLERYLLGMGIPKTAILKGIDSTNTYDDITMLRLALQDMDASVLIIVTSDFHIPRASLLAASIYTSHL